MNDNDQTIGSLFCRRRRLILQHSTGLNLLRGVMWHDGNLSATSGSQIVSNDSRFSDFLEVSNISRVRLVLETTTDRSSKLCQYDSGMSYVGVNRLYKGINRIKLNDNCCFISVVVNKLDGEKSISMVPLEYRVAKEMLNFE